MSEKSEGFADQDEILLGVLTVIDRDANISQRTISRELGVALGLANAYLKRCVKKGFVKIQQVPKRRYTYYLTPHGFTEKARLTGEYLSASFTFFRRARMQLSGLMGTCAERGWRRVVLAGISDLAEIAIICAHDYPIQLVAIVDPSQAGGTLYGLPVHADFPECGAFDAIIITAFNGADEIYRVAADHVGSERTMAPHLLHVALPASPADQVVAQ